MSVDYGHSLYYPYIHIQDDEWAKVAALYYDRLYRIVPAGFGLLDNRIVQRLRDEGFIVDLDPGYEADEVGFEFLQFANGQLRNRAKRVAIAKRIGVELNRKQRFRIHSAKLSHILRRELPRLGLAKAPGPRAKDRAWYQFEPVTGALYMTALATRMAERRGLTIVTDTSIYQPIVQAFQFEHDESRGDKSYDLASLVIQTAIPQNLRQVSVDKVLEFRAHYAMERRRFHDAVAAVGRALPRIVDSDALRACLEAHAKRIEDEVKTLRASLAEVAIAAAPGLMGISIPTWASKLSEVAGPEAPLVAATGLLAVAAFTITKAISDYRKSRRNSSWSYVLTLERGLRGDALARNLATARILL